MREVLPLDAVINPIGSMDVISALRALSFVTEGFIPFFVQVMALLMQRLVEVPLSAVFGRRAAALAMEKGFYRQGVEWLEQCLMLVWGQLNLRAPAPLDAVRIKGLQGVQVESEARLGQIVLAFLGLCIYIDLEADDDVSIAHPEQLAYFIVEEWLKLKKEVSSDPLLKDLFKSQSFDHILNAARTAPVVMLNLWGTQCNALVLYGEGRSECFRLDGVTEDLAATLQSSLLEGLQSHHFRSRGDEIQAEHRGSQFAPKTSIIHRVLAVLWKKVVKPIFDKMQLQVCTCQCYMR